MTDTRDDGGLAFPIHVAAGTSQANGVSVSRMEQMHYGLTKREYFAGQAMMGLLANPTFFEMRSPASWDDTLTTTAKYAADALIAALKDTKP